MPASPLPQAIAVTAHRRPDHLRRLLASLASARDAVSWQVFLSIEPAGQQDVIVDIANSFATRLTIRHRVNAEPLGIRRNPYANVEWALAEGAAAVLLLEDDLVLDVEGLRWASLLIAGALQQPDVMCANLLFTTCMSESIHVAAPCEFEALHDVVLRTRFFSSYGLLFTRAQWQRHFVPHWFHDSPRMEGWRGQQAVGWDVAMNRVLLCNPALVVLQSVVPRVTHDGAGGMHVGTEFQSMSFDHVQVNVRPELELQRLRVLDPLTELAQLPTPSLRMFVNLARHLWTLHGSTLQYKHRLPAMGEATPKKWLRLGSYEYTLFRRRGPRPPTGAG